MPSNHPITTDIAEEVIAEGRPFRDEDGRRVKRALRRGMPSRRVLAEHTIGGVEYSFHATKGWRAARRENAR